MTTAIKTSWMTNWMTTGLMSWSWNLRLRTNWNWTKKTIGLMTMNSNWIRTKSLNSIGKKKTSCYLKSLSLILTMNSMMTKS